MEIWLDSTSFEKIKRAQDLEILHGVTTNPALIRQAGKPANETLDALLMAQAGPVTAQVTAEEAEGMVRQAEEWISHSQRLMIKIPVTQEGYKAMGLLAKRSIPIMATMVFHPHQALLAALAGADYVAPYVTRMEKAGINSIAALAQMRAILSQYAFKTKILAASISTLEQIVQCAQLGIPAITLKESLFDLLTQDHPHTLACLPM